MSTLLTWAPSPTTRRSSPIWEGFRAYFADAGPRRSTTCSSRTTSGRSRRTSPGTSRRVELAARLARGRASGARPRPARRGRSRCATPTAISPAWSWSAPMRTSRKPERICAGKRVAVGALRLAAGDADPARHLVGRGLGPGADFEVRAARRARRQARRSHRRRARRGAGARSRARVDAACIIDGNHLAFAREGTLPSGATRVLAPDGAVRPLQLHRARRRAAGGRRRSASCCWRCRYDDPEVRPLLDLEGLKEWRRGRVSGYQRARRGVLRVRHARSVPGRGRLTPMARVDLEDARARRGRAPDRRARPRPHCRSGARSTWSAARPTWPCICAPGAAPRATASRSGEGRLRVIQGGAEADALGRRRRAPARPSSAPARFRGDHPDARWGLAARGALVEAGAPRVRLRRSRPRPRSGPTRPRTSTRRRRRRSGIRRPRSRGTRRSIMPDEVEDAVVQVMTYLIENETRRCSCRRASSAASTRTSAR